MIHLSIYRFGKKMKEGYKTKLLIDMGQVFSASNLHVSLRLWCVFWLEIWVQTPGICLVWRCHRCAAQKRHHRGGVLKKPWWRRRFVEISEELGGRHPALLTMCVLFVIFCPFCHPEWSWFLCWSWHCWCCRQPSPHRSEPNTKMPWNGEDVSRLQLWPGTRRGVANHILNDNGAAILWGLHGHGTFS